MSRPFLATYRPLCRTPAGRTASEQHGLKPFIDGSCRREPNLESSYPTITALCRGAMFAPRLTKGDRVAYMTKKGFYGPGEAHWRLVALLRVVETFDSHREAANWFVRRQLPIPRNCMVDETTPAPLHLTDGVVGGCRDCTDEERLELWDASYAERAKAHPQVRVCESMFLELEHPPAIYTADWIHWLGRIPATQTPPQIDEALWTRLQRVTRHSRARARPRHCSDVPEKTNRSGASPGSHCT